MKISVVNHEYVRLLVLCDVFGFISIFMLIKFVFTKKKTAVSLLRFDVSGSCPLF